MLNDLIKSEDCGPHIRAAYEAAKARWRSLTAAVPTATDKLMTIRPPTPATELPK
jgi:hypothetical protein